MTKCKSPSAKNAVIRVFQDFEGDGDFSNIKLRDTIN